MNFVRKVYSILACQLSCTCAFIFWVQQVAGAKEFMVMHFGILIVACVGSIVSMIAILCCFGRKHPINIILLAVFTVCESYMVAGITIPFHPQKVLMASLVTALVTISLTIYAFRTKVKIEVFGALAFVVYFAMLPILILSLFVFPGNIMITLYNVLGVFLYSLFLIIDTMMICDNRGLSG